MHVIELFIYLVELAIVAGLVVATAFGVASFIAGVIVTVRGESQPD